MSLPYYEITCSSCDYTSGYSFDVSYEYEGGRSSLCQPDLAQGWCEDCQRIVTICVPQTAETVKDDIAELTESVRTEEKKRVKRKYLLFKQHADQELIDAWHHRIIDLNECVEYFRKNNIQKRCLTCGSQNVIQVDLPSEHGERLPVGVRHTCGGEIMADMQGRIGYTELPKVIYDIQGNIVLDERDSFVEPE